MEETAAGLVVLRGRDVRFVPADVARQVVARPVVSVVPGTDVGVALVAGRIIAVIEVGPERDHLVLCSVAGQDIAFSGLTVLSSGVYPCVNDQIRYEEKLIPALNVVKELQRVEQRLWNARHQAGGDV